MVQEQDVEQLSLKNNRRRRIFRVELVSPILNLPFAAIFLILMITNWTYYDLFNNTLSRAFGLKIDWVMFIIVTMGAIIVMNVILFIIGLWRIDLLHKGRFPVLLSLPAITITFMIIFLLLVINVEKRVNLDYIFFMLGEAALVVYLGTSVATFSILLIIFFSCWRLWSYPATWKTWRDSVITLKPKIAAITTLISSGVAATLLWLVCFKYAATDAFWSSFRVIYSSFVPWTGLGVLLWISGILTGVIVQIKHKRVKKLNAYSYPILLFITALFQVIGIIIAITEFPSTGGNIWWAILPFMIPVSIISFIFIISRKLKSLSIKKTRGNRFYNRLRWVVITALCATPYAFIFYVPLGINPPSVALHFNERMVMLNDIQVPFQGDVVYPSFEAQNFTLDTISNGTRYSLDLGGDWKWKFTNNSIDKSLYLRTESVVASLTNGEHMPEYDDSTWSKISIPRPNCFPYWQGVEDEERYGVHWYRKAIVVPETYIDRQLLLKFYGGGYILDLWINGGYVGYHEVTQFPFVFDVTRFIQPNQTNLFAIRVEDPSWRKTSDVGNIWSDKHIPASMDFFKYGGLIREIHLEALPLANIARADVKLLDMETINHVQGNLTVQVDVSVHCPTSRPLAGTSINLSLEMYPLDFPNNTAAGSRETWLFANYSKPTVIIQNRTLNLTGLNETSYTAHRVIFAVENVSLWSTKNPSLYMIALNLTNPAFPSQPIDVFYTQTGFRTLETTTDQILLNGADLKLSGAALLEEMWDPHGQSVEDGHIMMKLDLLKDINVNFIRMSSHPFHPNWYLFAERLGITTWCEGPLCWMNEIDFTQLFIRDAIEPIWIQTVFPNINRPGIIFWGGPNEPWAADDCIKFLKVSNNYLNEIDGTRFFSYAAVSSHTWHSGFKDANLPVLSPNNYGGTFDGIRYAFYDETIKSLEEWTKNNPNKPLITMEFGYWQESSWNGTEWIPDYTNQIKCLNETLQAFIDYNASGVTWWISFDYIGYQNQEERWYYNGMGVYNLDGTEMKPTGYIMRDLYGNFTITNL